MTNNWEVFTEKICPNCLHKLVNDEGDHTEEELIKMQETLSNWEKEKYVPAGLNDCTEGEFGWRNCSLCGALAGERYLYNFFDKSKEI